MSEVGAQHRRWPPGTSHWSLQWPPTSTPWQTRLESQQNNTNACHTKHCSFIVCQQR